MRNIRQNLFWAFAYNFAGLPLAAGALYPFTGWLLHPMVASIAMSLSSFTVVDQRPPPSARAALLTRRQGGRACARPP
jgi:hypothetical protein